MDEEMTEWTKAAAYESFPIEHLGLNTRAYNALKREGITTIGQIMDKTVRELLEIRAVGAGSVGSLLESMGGLQMEDRVRELEDRVAFLERAAFQEKEDE